LPKPKKIRIVQSPPAVNYFKPRGIPMSRLTQVALTLDEFEALRLVDRDGLDQAKAAEHLGVSRPTCARILESAHRKVADAITGGMAIVIEGGHFDFLKNRLLCDECGHSWETPGEAARYNGTAACPSCGSTTVADLAQRYGPPPRKGKGGHGRGRGRGGNTP